MKNYTNTYCNPIKLPDYPYTPSANPDYNPPESKFDPGAMDADVPQKLKDVFDFTFASDVRGPYRETADPTCMYYDGKWYVYPSCGMAYVSEDFVHWEKHEVSPAYIGHAPTIEQHRGQFLFSANSAGLWIADNPLGPLTFVNDFHTPSGEAIKCNDPMIFADDDGRLYFYWGMDNEGIRGAELDPEKPWQMITEPKHLFPFDPEHEWERLGEHNEDYGNAFIEGSWMFKYGDTYYLTYSAAGTEFSTYAMGCYTSKSPLSGFKCQELNPICKDTHGLVRGVGHGSIVRGPKGTLWVFYTIAVGYMGNLERRIGFDPAGIDENGQLYTIAASETPQWAPGFCKHPELGNDAGLTCISARKSVRASSAMQGREPLYALDESMLTWWQPEADDTKKRLEIFLRGRFDIAAVRICWRECGLDPKHGVPAGPIRYKIETSMDTADWTMVCDMSENNKDYLVDYQTFEPVTAKYIRIEICGAPEGIQPGIIDFSVFGTSVYKSPEQF